MTARVFLGIFEAGFGPVITIYLCKKSISAGYDAVGLNVYVTYMQRSSIHGRSWDLGYVICVSGNFTLIDWFLDFKLALWFGFATVAGAFGGLIAFGVQHIHSSVADWRLLFIIEVSKRMYKV